MNKSVDKQTIVLKKYKEIKKRLEKCLEEIKKPQLLSSGKNLRGAILFIERNLIIVLNQINLRDSLYEGKGKGIEKAPSEDEIEEDKEKTIDVTFEQITRLLGKFDRILKEIGKLEKRKDIIKRIGANFKKFADRVKKDLGNIYIRESAEEIAKIRKGVARLKDTNETLLGFVKQEYSLEEKEDQVLKMLVRGLRRDSKKFMEIIYKYKLRNVDQFVDRFRHFDINLEGKEEKIIINYITPLLLRAHQATGDFISLIEKEDEGIAVLDGFAQRVSKALAEHKTIKEPVDIEASQNLEIIEKLKITIMKEEKLRFGTIKELEKKIEDAVEEVIKIDARRDESFKRFVEVGKHVPPSELEYRGGQKKKWKGRWEKVGKGWRWARKNVLYISKEVPPHGGGS